MFGSRFLLLAASSLFLALTSCTASGSVTATAPKGDAKPALPPSSLSEADAREGCTAIANAMCKKLLACSPKIAEIEGNDDTAACVDREMRVCATDLLLPGVVVTKNELVACAPRISGSACDSPVFGMAECAIHGTALANAGCAIDEQCRSGICAKSGACGKCVDRVALGGTCRGDAQCPADSACEHSVCTPLVRLGQMCKGKRCTSGGACSDKTNRCEPAGALGQPASDVGMKCRGQDMTPVNGTCLPIGPIAAPGQPCGPAAKGASEVVSCKAGVCSTRGKCLADVPEGGACDSAHELFCASPFSCHDGKCRLFSANDDNVKRCF